MIAVMHVKGAALEDVARVVEAHLAGEGYTVAAGDVAPVDRFDTSVREIVLAAQDGFVSVVDHPFAETAWGEALSEGWPARDAAREPVDLPRVALATVSSPGRRKPTRSRGPTRTGRRWSASSSRPCRGPA